MTNFSSKIVVEGVNPYDNKISGLQLASPNTLVTLPVTVVKSGTETGRAPSSVPLSVVLLSVVVSVVESAGASSESLYYAKKKSTKKILK